MKIGFLYGGQGSQEEEMGLDFYENEKIARDFYDNLKLEKDVKKISFYGSKEVLKNTENTQVVLIAYDLMIKKLLSSKKIEADAVAGLSIGEFAALFTAGVLNEEDTLKIAEFRGNEMAKISKNFETEMYAIIGMEEESLKKICIEKSRVENKVFISNINTKNQIVISGTIKETREVVDEVKKLGKKAIKLNVSGPFHTEYMQSVSDKLRCEFNKINFSNEKTDIYFNLLGNKNLNGLNVKEIMARQVSECVRFEECLLNMINDGVDTFIEIGYFNILKGFIKKINRKVEVYSISDYESYKNFIEVFKE